jgi:FdhD protein
MIKTDKAPPPLIVPDPADPRLTERAMGTDQTGAAVEIKVPVERPLTLYLNAQERMGIPILVSRSGFTA